MTKTWPASALVIGAGRAGGSFARTLARARVATSVLSKRRHPKTKEIRFISGPIDSVADFDLIVIATPDSIVGAVAAELPATPGDRRATVVHLAGALGLDTLEAARDKGFRTGSMHPLQSIATPDTSLEGCPTGIAGSAAGTRKDLVALAKRLGLVPLTPNDARAAYHAAACVSGNYVQVLVEAALRLFEDAGLSRKDAIRAIERLSTSALRNSIERGPAPGLTGPIARGDVDTVIRHLEAIRDPDVKGLYVAAGKIAAQLANQRGTDVEEIAFVLDEASVGERD